MTNESLEQRARELLAAEFDKDGLHLTARDLLENGADRQSVSEYALRAILAALESTPAQGVPTWDAKERAAIAEMMEAQELSEPQLIRQALRQYQHDWLLRRAGETCTWSGDAQRARDFAGDSARTAPAEGGVALEGNILESLQADGVFTKERAHEVFGGLRRAPRHIHTEPLPSPATTAPVVPHTDESVDAMQAKMADLGFVVPVRVISEAMRSVIDTARPAKAEGDAMVVKLQALVEKWREAATLANEHETDVGMGFEQCADELENTFHTARTVSRGES